MSIFQIKQYNFQYPLEQNLALCDINIEFEEGKFYVICGKSGCGKSTLLRQLKTTLTPKGSIQGEVFYNGRILGGVSQKEQSTEIGFVFQNPDNQIVTDKVWHELAFGLESLGYDSAGIHLRVAEMASYFGIGDWFHCDVSELSGGQKQLLNLASIMTMHPKVLLLDEPTSQLDPIASSDFLNTLHKINIEFGITIILSEHNLEDVVSFADSVIVMEEGRIVTQGSVEQIGQELRRKYHDMFLAMPAPMRIYAGTDSSLECPYTVAMGRRWLEQEMQEQVAKGSKRQEAISPEQERSDFTLQSRFLAQKMKKASSLESAVRIRNLCFRYDKKFPDVVNGLSLDIYSGEIFAIMGSNGAGKSTVLNLIAGILKPYQGSIELFGQKLQKYSDKELYHGLFSVLPQDPTSLFVKKTVAEELNAANVKTITRQDSKKKALLQEIIEATKIAHLLERHPYDLSGGEQQKAALAKVLLQQPKILLLDEPTKGLDAHFKNEFGNLLKELSGRGVTVVLVSHDLEFCAQFADRVGLFFDRSVATVQKTRDFFAENHFYTTAANRMARQFFPDAITVDEVVQRLSQADLVCEAKAVNPSEINENRKTVSSALSEIDENRKTMSSVLSEVNENTEVDSSALSEKNAAIEAKPVDLSDGQKNKIDRFYSYLCFLLAILILVPATIWIGVTFFEDRKYMLISLAIVIYATVPFLGLFQRRKPNARILVVIAVMTALAVAGRAAFFMVPSIKPMAAITIIAGVSLGAESGFMVGALSMIASNMLFGQGPWTPWQMFAMGLIGLLAGIFSQAGWLSAKRWRMCLYGFLATLLIYGGIMNPASLVMMSYEITPENLLAIYLSGLPLDMVHAVSTAVFILLAGRALIDKLERVKIRYDIMDI